jgi:GNAT superfamily N-acetyltransferase
MRQRRETVELGTIKARMGRGIRPSAAQNVAAFGAGVFVLGLICALLRIGRNAFRYARNNERTSLSRATSIQLTKNSSLLGDAMTIRRCRDDERDGILSIINAAAEAYRGVIPADRWHEPYMPGEEFDRERAAGVVFWGYQDRGRLAGIMGLQDVRDVTLIRHAYVAPARQRGGVGGKLLEHLQQMSTKPMLVGTWAAATWAIRFYERHGFALVSPQRKTALLKSYWTIPERQIETSVVLANPRDRS